MIRTQISLEEEQMERLRALASRQNVSVASLLRQAVDALLDGATPDARTRALAVAGKYRSGSPGQTSRDHDDALVDAFSA